MGNPLTRLGWLALLLLALPISTAAAEDDNDQRARELFVQGDGLYAEGKFEEALGAFERAYSLSPRPLLLYNIANALEKLGRWEQAAESLRGYRPYARDDELVLIDTRIANWESRAERERLEKARAARNKRRFSAKSISLLTSGSTMLALGGTFAILTKIKRNDIDARCGKTQSGVRVCESGTSDLFAKERNFSIIADLGLLSGAVLTSVGIYFMVREKKDHEKRQRETRVSPIVGTSVGGVQVEGSF